MKRKEKPASLVSDPENQNLALGIFLTVVCWTILAITAALVKEAALEVPAVEILFFQNLFSTIILIPITFRKGISAIYSEKLPLVIFRSFMGTFSWYCLFLAVSLIPLVNATLLNNTAPLFVPFVIWIWLRTKIKPKLWWGILIGFVGIILILRPSIHFINAGSLFGLLSGISGGIVMVTLRKLKEERPMKIVFYYAFIAMLITFPFTLFQWKAPSARVWVLFLLISILYTTYQSMYTRSMRYACPSYLAPFSYSYVVAAGAIDWIIWGHAPSVLTTIGILLVFVGGITTVLLSGKRRVSHK